MNTIEISKANLLMHLQEAILMAERLNLVVAIELKPNLPLSMGNYTMVPTVYEGRESQQKISTVDELEIILEGFSKNFHVLKIVTCEWKENLQMVLINIGGDNQIPIGIITQETWEELIKRSKSNTDDDFSNLLSVVH